MVRFALFGNYFYGICALALSINTSVQLDFPLLPFPFYALLFMATVGFYTYSLLRTDLSACHNNDRTAWYNRYQKGLRISQWALAAGIALSLFWCFKTLGGRIPAVETWGIALAIPVLAGAYYGFGALNLRRFGWLKPFLVSFVWAGVVTIYPILFHSVHYKIAEGTSEVATWLAATNFLYIFILCILFDIKDYACDSREGVRTFVTVYGLRKTLFHIAMPLVVLGIMTTMIYSGKRAFSLQQLGIILVPYIGLFAAVYAMKRRRSIIFHLFYIDGLMLLKAVCGMLAAQF